MNLLEDRLHAFLLYRKKNDMLKKYALDKATKMGMDYTQSLHQQRWQRHSNSFNEWTRIIRLRSMFRGILGKTTARNTEETFLLQIECTEEDLAEHVTLKTAPQTQPAHVQYDREVKTHKVVTNIQDKDQRFTKF